MRPYKYLTLCENAIPQRLRKIALHLTPRVMCLITPRLTEFGLMCD